MDGAFLNHEIHERHEMRMCFQGGRGLGGRGSTRAAAQVDSFLEPRMNTDQHGWTGMLVVSHEVLGVGLRAIDGWTRMDGGVSEPRMNMDGEARGGRNEKRARCWGAGTGRGV